MEEPQIKDPKTFLSLPIIISPRMPKSVNFHNDTQREAFFQEVAFKSFRLARDFVRKQTGRELLPPPTYQGARFKSEEDIQRIQGAKEAEEAKRKASEESKKQRYLAKFAKQAQTEAKLRKEKEKREDMKKLTDIKNTKDSHKKARKLSALIDGNASDDFDVGVADNDDDVEDTKPQKRTRHSDKKVSAKRSFKNEKFGFGGKKRGLKRNGEESLNDDSSFSVRKNKSPFSGKVKKSKAPKNRPGKQRRQQMRNKKASRKQK